MKNCIDPLDKRLEEIEDRLMSALRAGESTGTVKALEREGNTLRAIRARRQRPQRRWPTALTFAAGALLIVAVASLVRVRSSFGLDAHVMEVEFVAAS